MTVLSDLEDIAPLRRGQAVDVWMPPSLRGALWAFVQHALDPERVDQADLQMKSALRPPGRGTTELGRLLGGKNALARLASKQ